MRYDRIYNYKFKDSTLKEYQMYNMNERDIFVVTEDYFRFNNPEEDRRFQTAKAIVLDEDKRHYLVELTVNEDENTKTYMEVAEINGDLQVLKDRYVVKYGENLYSFDNFYDACVKLEKIEGAELMLDLEYPTGDTAVIEDILEIYSEIISEK